MIVTEIKKEVDSQHLEQLLGLLSTTLKLDLLEACTLLENVVVHCQVIVGVFDHSKLIGVVFASQRENKKKWLLSSPMVLHRKYSTKAIDCRLLNFVKNEIRYREGEQIQLVPDLTSFLQMIDCHVSF